MFISPHYAIEQGWITHPYHKTLDEWKQTKLISPNAIDFDIGTLCGIEEDSVDRFVLSEKVKQHQKWTNLHPVVYDTGADVKEQGWTLLPGKIYDFMSSMYVNIPPGVCAMVFTRSTLARNGLHIVTGLWDAGFRGNLGGVIHVRSSKPAILIHGTRIGQVAFIRSDDSGVVYAGGYNTEQGQHWSDTTKEKHNGK